jgi:hypothetical protein
LASLVTADTVDLAVLEAIQVMVDTLVMEAFLVMEDMEVTLVMVDIMDTMGVTTGDIMVDITVDIMVVTTGDITVDTMVVTTGDITAVMADTVINKVSAETEDAPCA